MIIVKDSLYSLEVCIVLCFLIPGNVQKPVEIAAGYRSFTASLRQHLKATEFFPRFFLDMVRIRFVFDLLPHLVNVIGTTGDISEFLTDGPELFPQIVLTL